MSAREKWAYAVGNIPFAAKDAAFANFVVFYYTQIHGLSGTLAGLAMFIALSWDAISDPIVGSWSDNFRSRWGRRHPLLVAGGLPTALLFLALFTPPEQFGDAGIFLWLLGVSILLRTFLTIYFIPYSAMGAELSTDYDERTIIAKARVTMGWLAGMALPAVAFILFFGPRDGVDGRLVAVNYWHYGVLSALVAGITAVVCIIGTRSVIPRLPTASPAHKFSWRDPLKDLQMALTNRNFRLSVGANLAFGMSAGVYTTLSLYLGTYFWEFSADQLAGMVLPTAIATLMAFMALHRLGRRFDKPHLLAFASLALALNALWFLGSRLLGFLPENGHAIIYPLLLLNTGIGVFMIVSMQVLAASLAADIIDEQEMATGKRQEGVVFAAGAFVQKATTGAGALLAGIVIDLSGITGDSVPGSVDTDVLQALGWFTLAMTAGLALIAFFFNTRLRLGRKDHHKVRTQLAASTPGD
ncbi:MFS transporter [Candidatus Litorirhabdus singularis]|uniref:MFS transporter n=1 Tax=Candidatus Litorirhabdus singularis TaxID=2518993 RepID=UPI0024307878|nr:MFS transporter [Candidatus Litorirhabdus singularis]